MIVLESRQTMKPETREYNADVDETRVRASELETAPLFLERESLPPRGRCYIQKRCRVPRVRTAALLGLVHTGTSASETRRCG